jgi:hypothetical protein
VVSYSADKNYNAWALTMAAWNHGAAKLETAHVLPSDPLIAHSFTHPIGQVEPGLDGNGLIPEYRTMGYVPGKLSEQYYLQTGRLLYPALGTCSTTEGTPNTHDISKRTTTTPVYSGRHSQQEGPASEGHYTDMLSMLCESYHAECSEQRTKATQTATWRWCKGIYDGSCDDITEPTKLTDDYYDWTHFTFPTFTYNSETLECSIVGWSYDILNQIDWYGLSSGVYTSGEVHGYEYISATLAIIPTGRNCRELIRTLKESYATDLDLVVKCARNATTDYIQWTHDKLYAVPFTIVPGTRKGWKETYFLTMYQRGSSSGGSHTAQVKDKYNDDYYENP